MLVGGQHSQFSSQRLATQGAIDGLCDSKTCQAHDAKGRRTPSHDKALLLTGTQIL